MADISLCPNAKYDDEHYAIICTKDKTRCACQRYCGIDGYFSLTYNAENCKSNPKSPFYKKEKQNPIKKFFGI